MAKRFIDTEIWFRDDVIDATPKQKLIFIYLFTSCSNIGIFTGSLKIASLSLGFKVEESDIFSVPVDVEKLGDGKYWLPKFCDFQYGTLSESCKPHKRYIEDLKKEGLYQRVCKGYTKGIQRVEEKEQEQEKEKEGEAGNKPKPPKSLQEVLEYCFIEKKLYFFDAWDFYEKNESENWWRSDGKPVKDWMAYLRNWASQKYAKKIKKSTHVDLANDFVKTIEDAELKKTVFKGIYEHFKSNP